MFGTNITSADDQLMKVPVEYFYNSLKNPKPNNEARIRQLRIVYELDSKQYSKAKRALPYIVCGIFKPEIRRKENFAYTEFFIVDIDKLHSKGQSAQDLRKRLEEDPRVMMCFLSPSEDGLKLMFRLKERCYDSGLYSVFYKEFIRRFAKQYELEQVVDTVTSDVSRACFISIDHDAYYNPGCELVDMEEVVSTQNPTEFFDTTHEHKALEAEEKEKSYSVHKQERQKDPEKEVMDEIKQRLGVRPQPKKRAAFIPPELETEMAKLYYYIEKTGIYIKEVTNINYAKQITIQVGTKTGCVNLFYGKRGFTPVITAKTETDNELNQLLLAVISNYLNGEFGSDENNSHLNKEQTPTYGQAETGQ